MSVEQTRGRLDCGRPGRRRAEEQGALPRGPHLRHQRHPDAEAGGGGPDLPRLSYPHARERPGRQGKSLRLQLRHELGAPLGGARGMLGRDPADPNTALFSIDVIQVPLARPENARVVSRPRIFADPRRGAIAGLWKGGDHGPGTQNTYETNMCHDITVYPGARPRGGGLLGKRHPPRHLRSGEARPARPGGRSRRSRTGTRPRSTTTAPR